MSKDSPSLFRQYVNEYMLSIEGWCGSVDSVLMLEAISKIQSSCKASGAFEIGVHNGRYLIALHNLCELGSWSVGIDLFSDQEKNVDHSGRGDLETTKNNLELYAREPHLVELMSGDSLELTRKNCEKLSDEYGKFRFVSIDGGHTAEHVVSDLINGAAVTHPSGLILVDDFFHPGFPGVTEGWYQLARTSLIPFIPLFLNRKKLVLCHVSMRPAFWEAMTKTIRTELDSICRFKVVRIGGHDVLYYHI